MPEYQGRPENERVWRAITRHTEGERKTAQRVGVSRWKVRELKAGWLAAGWLRKRDGGGVMVTDRAPKTLREGWAATPQGRTLHAPAPRVHRVGDPCRVHRGKLKADLDRAVDVAALDWWVSAKAHPNGVVYHAFEIPCQTGSGVVGVPLQVIQPKRLDRPFQVVIQSANVMAKEAALLDMGYDGTLGWVQEAMASLLAGWLDRHREAMGPLVWTGLGNEDLEVAQEAHPMAVPGGDVQRDFVAVDRSDKFTPWDKEEEQTLRAFLKLRATEVAVERLEAGQDRMAGIVEQLAESVREQLDQVAAAVELLAGRKS